mmetsp:Transcript_3938/g.11835  ORF Transcript_3938/g.11835 Transcript_3938/m.11835 type:complete len:216 (-) Transcript_3938:533-1180(-)
MTVSSCIMFPFWNPNAGKTLSNSAWRISRRCLANGASVRRLPWCVSKRDLRLLWTSGLLRCLIRASCSLRTCSSPSSPGLGGIGSGTNRSLSGSAVATQPTSGPEPAISRYIKRSPMREISSTTEPVERRSGSLADSSFAPSRTRMPPRSSPPTTRHWLYMGGSLRFSSFISFADRAIFSRNSLSCGRAQAVKRPGMQTSSKRTGAWGQNLLAMR